MSDITNLSGLKRPDGRMPDELRSISFQTDFCPHAIGSVLVSFGRTRVICAAMVEHGVPPWMRRQNVPGGWMTAEYSMLPYSTQDRKQRDSSRGKLDGRTVEIQRLIGRSLRAVFNLRDFEGKTLWIDCDVVEADGGTRTASVTGAYVAARIAIERLLRVGKLDKNPFSQAVAAISAGVVDGEVLLDLNYAEDKDASVDANIVMAADAGLIEVQGSGEGATYTREQLDALLDVGVDGIRRINILQEQAIQQALLMQS
jgi:ribonuclease PH